MLRRAFLCGLLLALAAIPLAAQIPGQSERARSIGKRLMCMCGCNQVLIECNHVGCSMSTGMLQKLDERIARNESDDLILQSFIQEFGQKVLAQPPSTGFGVTSWAMPLAVTLVGMTGIFFVLQRWRRRPAGAAAEAPLPKVSSEMLERARRETDLDADLDNLAARRRPS